jgi:hypothetical protein
MAGPPAPVDPGSDPATWSWPLLDETLALTSSQKAALAQQLQASAHTGNPRRQAAVSNSRSGSSENSTDAGLSQALQAATELGASPETAAAADGLLSVVAAAAAAVAEPQGLGAAAAGEDDVRLVPQLCLMFYDNSLQSFGYTESTEMERTLNFLAAKVGRFGRLEFMTSPWSLHAWVHGWVPFSTATASTCTCTLSFSTPACTRIAERLVQSALCMLPGSHADLLLCAVACLWSVQGVSVVGGASSGAGDLLYSPGADARR